MPGASLARRLVATQFPQWARLPLTPVPSAGTDNVLYRLGGDLVLRLPRRTGAAAAVETEQRWLPRLAPQLPLEIPVPVARGVPDAGYPYPWSVYRWLDGTDLVGEPDVDLADAAVRLGRFVAALRRADATGAPPSFRGGPVGALDATVHAALRDLGTVDADRALAVWRDACGAPPWPGPPVWLHADLYPVNLLARHGRLTAVIDFGGLGVGDPACDLLPAWALLTAPTRELFRAESRVDDATWRRGRGWALALGLGAMRAYRVTNPVLAALGRYTVAEVLAAG